MATRAMNLKMDEAEILDIKQVASVFNMTMTDVVKEAVKEYVDRLKQDPFYKLTANVEEASAEESLEILEAIDSLTDDELSISSSKRFAV